MRRRAVRVGLILALVVGRRRLLRTPGAPARPRPHRPRHDRRRHRQRRRSAGRIDRLLVEPGQAVTARPAAGRHRAGRTARRHAPTTATWPTAAAAGVAAERGALRLQEQQTDAAAPTRPERAPGRGDGLAGGGRGGPRQRPPRLRARPAVAQERPGVHRERSTRPARVRLAQARVRALERQADAARAALALARANAQQVAHAPRTAAGQPRGLGRGRRPTRQSRVRLGYTEVHAPIARHRRRPGGAPGRGGHSRTADRRRSSTRMTSGCAWTSRRPTSTACASATTCP